MIFHVQTPTLNQYSTPCLSKETTNQLLFGEEVRILERLEHSLYVESLISDYRGYVNGNSGLAEGAAKTTHFVRTPSTLLFKLPDIKTPNPIILPMLARVQVLRVKENFSETPSGWISSKHLLPNNTAAEIDLPKLITLAKNYLETPYLWGGNTIAGLDCSGLMHILWRRFGVNLPRDSQQQEHAEGWKTQTSTRAGDLVFWAGHVGLMINETELLHANAYTMRTSIEALETVQQRINKNFIIRRIG